MDSRSSAPQRRVLSRARGMAVDLTPLRQSVAFRWLWSGDVFVTLGRQIPLVAIPLQVYGLTGSSLMVGLVSLVQVVPLIVGSLIGGVVVDAYDRRRVLLVTQMGLLLIAAGLAANASLDRPQLWVIFGLATVQAAASGFDAPARRAALPHVVPLSLLPSALALQQILSNLGKLLIPALTGVLIAAFGINLVFWIYAGTFLAGLAATSRLPAMRPEGGGRKAGWSSLREGLAHVGTQPMIKAVFLLDISAMVFGLPRALFPAIGTDVLGGDAVTVGLLYSAPGAGALLGALTSGWMARVRRIGRVVMVWIAVYGLAIVGFGTSQWLPLSLACLVLSGSADMISATLRNTLITVITPDPLRGRVASVNKAVVSGGPLLGDTRAGVQATLTSAGLSIVTGGLACLAGVALIAWRYPVLRRVVFRGGMLVDDELPAAAPVAGR
jgi:MFS family permease